MKTEIKEISPTQKEIHLEIEPEAVKEVYNKVSQKYAKAANVPGFRKGFAPLDVVRLRFKEEIRAGMTSINNSTTGAEAHLPFGGNGWSGNGTRESGIWVLDAYTRWQAVNVDLSGRLQKAQIDLIDPEGGDTAALGVASAAIP